MNKQRREELLKVKTVLESLATTLERIKDDEEFAYDNMPENFQDSERADISQNAIDNLEYAVDSMEEVIDYLSEATE